MYHVTNVPGTEEQPKWGEVIGYMLQMTDSLIKAYWAFLLRVFQLLCSKVHFLISHLIQDCSMGTSQKKVYTILASGCPI